MTGLPQTHQHDSPHPEDVASHAHRTPLSRGARHGRTPTLKTMRRAAGRSVRLPPHPRHRVAPASSRHAVAPSIIHESGSASPRRRVPNRAPGPSKAPSRPSLARPWPAGASLRVLTACHEETHAVMSTSRLPIRHTGEMPRLRIASFFLIDPYSLTRHSVTSLREANTSRLTTQQRPGRALLTDVRNRAILWARERGRPVPSCVGRRLLTGCPCPGATVWPRLSMDCGGSGAAWRQPLVMMRNRAACGCMCAARVATPRFAYAST